MMTPEEAKQKLFDSARKDTDDLRKVLDAWRADTGCPLSNFIEILAVIVQEYRLIKVILGK